MDKLIQIDVFVFHYDRRTHLSQYMDSNNETVQTKMPNVFLFANRCMDGLIDQ